MEIDRKVISYQEFLNHPAEIYEQVLQGNEIIVQRGRGESVVLNATESAKGGKLSPEELAVFMSAAGGWADMDTETLKAQLRASRSMPPRPPVEI